MYFFMIFFPFRKIDLFWASKKITGNSVHCNSLQQCSIPPMEPIPALEPISVIPMKMSLSRNHHNLRSKKGQNMTLEPIPGTVRNNNSPTLEDKRTTVKWEEGRFNQGFNLANCYSRISMCLKKYVRARRLHGEFSRSATGDKKL